MNTVNKVLLAALVVQGGLVLLARWPKGGPAEPRDLVEVPAAELASVSITGRLAREEPKPPGPPVRLVNQDGSWVVENLDGFPAQLSLVQPVLDVIDAFQGRDPVATQAASHTNLAVDDTAFTRKIEIETGDGQKKTFFVGAGQGKTVMVRLDGEDDVFAVRGFTAWTIPDTPTRFIDRELLKVDLGTIDSATIQRPGQPPIAFAKGDDGKWSLPGLGPLDQADTAEFLGKLLTVRLTDPAGATVTPEMGLDGPNATVVTWTAPGGTPNRYVIGAAVPEKTNRFYLKSDTKPFVVEVTQQSVESALTKPVEPLVEVPDPLDEPIDIDE
jgi:hypothetical protein